MIRYICAWAGCGKRCHGLPPPDGWVCFATFIETQEPGVLRFQTDTVIRDAVLCPDHARELESLLKRI